jgi:hypothetical protein
MNELSFNIFFSNRMQGAHQSDPANTSKIGLWVADEILKASSASVWIWACTVIDTANRQKNNNSRKGVRVKDYKFMRDLVKMPTIPGN